jgi:predicted transcriptional regulator
MKEHVAEIVAAYVGHNTITPDRVPALIEAVNEALAGLGKTAESVSEQHVPAVPIRRSVGDNSITCLTCGWSGQMLKRHLSTAHGMTPTQYREHWKLPAEYPMVAKNYASRRSKLAKANGLGTRGRARK